MKELRVALIGGGFMGKAHSMAYAAAQVGGRGLDVMLKRQVLVDVNDEIAARQAHRLGWEEYSSDWRSVLERPDIDAVDVCTPPQFHAEIAIAAAHAGKHVFVEKPIANCVTDAAKMVDAVARHNVISQVGLNYRHAPAVEYTKQMLDAGDLGDPLHFRGSFLMELRPSETGAGDWRVQTTTGGSGSVGDIGSHIIDTAEYLVGDIRRVAARVRSTGWSGGWIAETDRTQEGAPDNSGVWIAEFANGAIGTFSTSFVAPGRRVEMQWQLDATRAAVEFGWNNRDQFRLALMDDQEGRRGFRVVHTNTDHPDGWWEIAGLGLGYVDISAIQLQKFARRILGEDIRVPTFGDALHVQQVVEGVYAAAESDTWVDIPSRRS